MNLDIICDEINDLVKKSQAALEEYMELGQKEVDNIVESMVKAGRKNSLFLADCAVKETKRGNINDKKIKNEFATEAVWEYIKDKKTVGVMGRNLELNCIEIADPVGVVAGITPMTNPTSTVMFKSIICAKTRNPIIFSFHPYAQNCSQETAKILYEAALSAGAPKNCIQWMNRSSVESAMTLINNDGVNLIFATGGPAMVRSAYSAGKPALGVGPGNVPVYIEKTSNLEDACSKIISSKTFDNGMICASEQSVIVDKEISSEFENIMKKMNSYFLNGTETDKISKTIINSKNKINPIIVGKTAYEIAKAAEINVPKDTNILIINAKGVGEAYPLSQEKLSPILTYYVANSATEAIDICEKVLEYGGLGHTASIHSNNDKVILEYAVKMKASRIICNSPSSQGAIGTLFNKNIPSFSLGCGTYGKNSTTDNISIKNLMNIKRLFIS